MSIIKSIQTWLEQFDGMELKTISKVLTDQTDEEASSYAVAPSGSGKISTDILGNKTFQNSYVFYAKEAAANEVDRQENYDFLESLTEWIEDKNDNKDLPVLPAGYEPEEIQVSNAMLFDIAEDGTGTYQVQIQFIFVKRRV